ncbi:hypothetical protein Z043_115517, partial [Scleropages formosus]
EEVKRGTGGGRRRRRLAGSRGGSIRVCRRPKCAGDQFSFGSVEPLEFGSPESRRNRVGLVLGASPGRSTAALRCRTSRGRVGSRSVLEILQIPASVLLGPGSWRSCRSGRSWLPPILQEPPRLLGVPSSREQYGLPRLQRPFRDDQNRVQDKLPSSRLTP